MQTMVIIAIFTDLLVKRKITRAALSQKYELSARTITRYVTVLTDAGIPIESKAGLGGGYILPETYKLDRLLFTGEEYKRIAACMRETADKYPDRIHETIIEKITETVSKNGNPRETKPFVSPVK